MTALIDQRIAETEQIKAEVKKTMDERESAAHALKKAQETLNVSAYELATKRLTAAETALKMYTDRLADIQGREIIEEDASEAVIAGLLDYEDNLREEYEADVAEPLRRVAEITEQYRRTVIDIETTLHRWTAEIRPNRRLDGRGERQNKVVPIRYEPYFGGALCMILDKIVSDKRLQDFIHN